jgi:hypothetical protein
MSDIAQQIEHLRLAELQFRLASVVRLASTFKTQPRDLPIEWSHEKHSVRYDEIALSEDGADYAASGFCFHDGEEFAGSAECSELLKVNKWRVR